MKSTVSVLACDIGAGSGRLLQAKFNGDTINLEQLTRFKNGSIKVGNSLYWDIIGIYRSLTEGLVKAKSEGSEAVSLGIDTWGNDFAFLDKKGYMIENSYSYRDNRTEKILPFVKGLISEYALYSRNGIQQVRMNTLYQIMALLKDRQYLFDITDKLLFIPDLISYFLTGELHSEYTLSTISQLYNYENKDWDYMLMELLGIPKQLFSPIMTPGDRCGVISPSICRELNIHKLPLVAVGAHDTASAIVAVPETSGRIIYISSGTWSIVGTETDFPMINELAFKYNFSNEGGVGGRIRLLKNVMGMWILQEVQRGFALLGRKYSFEELSQLAFKVEAFGPAIDPDDNCFYEPTNMPEVIQNYCSRTGQKVPQSDGEIIRAALEGLALKYRYVIGQLEEILAVSLGSIFIVGGGSMDKLLCQLTANYCNRPVFAGPVEATALGNALTQLISLGELSDLNEARSLVKKSFPPIAYHPTGSGKWEDYYQRFLKVTQLKTVG